MSSPSVPVQLVRFGVFEANLRSGELRKSGIKVKLHDQPFKVLTLLLERPGEVVTREELRQKLWSADTFVDFNHGLNNAVLRLREVLGDSADTPRFIETIPRRGYRLIVAVDSVTDGNSGPIQIGTLETSSAQATKPVATPHASAAPPPHRSEQRESSTRRPKFWRSAIVVASMLAVTAVFVGTLWMRRPAKTSGIQSLVVLPFQNVSGDPTQDYLADGVTDLLITHLARLDSLRVISRTSAMHYQNSRLKLPEIARELDVDAVVEGTVSRTEHSVRINAQLIDARNDRHLWAEVFERDVHDLPTLQGDLARTIADQVESHSDAKRHVRLQTKSVNPEAYELYLRGRYCWNKRTEDGFDKAIEFFGQAIAIQPDYAQAYAGLADSYAFLNGWKKRGLSRAETNALARASARKALELDDTLAEAHASLASISYVYDWDWVLAEKEFQRAIDLSPNYATAHQWYAFYCFSRNRIEEGLHEIRRAQQLDPQSLIIQNDVGQLLYEARRYDQAIVAERRTLEMDESLPWPHLWLGLSYLAKQQNQEAIAELQTHARLSGDTPAAMAMLGMAYARTGRPAESRQVLQQIRALPMEKYDSTADIAFLLEALGQKDEAYAWLNRVVSGRPTPLKSLHVLPYLDPLRSDPRFQDLERQIGLP